MGSCISLCCWRHHTVKDVAGKQIDLTKDFEEFSEIEGLLTDPPTRLAIYNDNFEEEE
ncbi:orf38 [Alcelaphine gammaherpesvirus 2]|uniref:Cytoplasmic envelopment protein 3 n=1 Tax=Alcelaphine gammaherpesvirus 2 TaxID=138184 RepID=A0A068A9X0_9GAMA|nr:orf38 [Alcelaphine gammaherpesvirus 2]AIA62074.1 orf38 [Alcelaphine gammaherpesvirus 2]